MHITRISSLILLPLAFFSFNALTSIPSERIYGGNRKEIVDFIKQFPFDEYSIYNVPNSGKFYVDAIDDYIKGNLRSGKEWEPQIKEYLIKYAKPHSVVLDIGTHIGTHALTLARQVGSQGRVLAFEPQPKIFRELVMNMTLNEVSNIDYYPAAVGDRVGSIELSPLRSGNEAGTSLINGGTGQFVPLLSIDSLHLNNVSLMKIDVEFQENAVLDGATETIERCRPVILIEIYGELGFEVAPQEIKDQILFTISKLEEMRYTVRCLGWADYLALPTDP